MPDNNFWVDGESEKDNLRLGSTYPPVKVYVSAIDLARLNSKEPIMCSVILADGKELDIELLLETDRDIFSKDLRKVLDETQDST